MSGDSRWLAVYLRSLLRARFSPVTLILYLFLLTGLLTFLSLRDLLWVTSAERPATEFGVTQSSELKRPATESTRPEETEEAKTEESVERQQDDTQNGDHWEPIRQRMKKRSERIKQICRKHPKFRAPRPSENLIYDRKHSLIWCPIFKAGSTNWLQFLCKVNGVKHWPKQSQGQGCPIEALRSAAGPVRPLWTPPEGVLPFVIVRHPLERLLSAFRDKLENPAVHRYYRGKKAKMVARHRHRETFTAAPVSARELHLMAPPPPAQPEKVAPLSFAEFMRSVAVGDVGDEHWNPYYALCTPCNIKFQLIGKFETLREDQQFIIRELGLEKYEEFLPSYANYNPLGATDDVAKKYFSQLTRSELMAVYRFYKIDFAMYNYTVDEYLQYVKPDNVTRT